MNIKNRVGPRTDPWGTPLVAWITAENAPAILTLEERLKINAASQRERRPLTPTFSQWDTVKLWGITSNALEKSKNIQSTFCLSSAALERSLRRQIDYSGKTGKEEIHAAKDEVGYERSRMFVGNGWWSSP
jgi:hypothetical protein